MRTPANPMHERDMGAAQHVVSDWIRSLSKTAQDAISKHDFEQLQIRIAMQRQEARKEVA